MKSKEMTIHSITRQAWASKNQPDNQKRDFQT